MTSQYRIHHIDFNLGSSYPLVTVEDLQNNEQQTHIADHLAQNGGLVQGLNTRDRQMIEDLVKDGIRLRTKQAAKALNAAKILSFNQTALIHAVA